jgi:hypothetical protein
MIFPTDPENGSGKSFGAMPSVPGVTAASAMIEPQVARRKPAHY